MWHPSTSMPIARVTTKRAIHRLRGVKRFDSGPAGSVVPNPYASLLDFTGYWKCDETSGSDMIDQSANANLLTQLNVVGSAAGKIGNCRTFVSASTQLASRASNASLQRARSWSFVYWFNHATVPGYQIHLSKDDTGNREFLLALNPAGKVELQIGALGAAATSTLSPVAGTWYHCVVTWNQITKVASIIINNGTPDVSAPMASPITAGAANFTVGAYLMPSAPSLYLNGKMDDIVMYDRILTPAEITLQFLRTTPLV